jgi:hypothetical protein
LFYLSPSRRENPKAAWAAGLVLTLFGIAMMAGRFFTSIGFDSSPELLAWIIHIVIDIFYE